MSRFVLVLTSAPARPAVTDAVADLAWAAIPEGQRRARTWLSPGEAWQGCFEDDTEPAARAADVRRALAGTAVDVNVVADGPERRKRLLVADMDSTIIQQECIDEIADFAGVKPHVAAITERAMRGELDFAAALRERVALLAGLGADVLDRVFTERIRLMPGARTLVMTMRRTGAATALVSGGFDFFTSRVAALAGFESNQANVLEVADGRLAGTVREPILGRDAKLAALERLRQTQGLAPASTMAVGDGANDLAMLGAAGIGVAYRAKPIVAEQAHAAITHGDLTALLYLQGYAKSEFTA
jgi:phosphoserine phosphatase